MIYLPIALTVLSSATYHFMLKQASQRLSPFAILFWCYLIAAGTCLAFVFLTNADLRIASALKGKMYVPGVLALAIVGIEVGYLLTYKNGGQVGKVAMVAQLSSIILMLFIGYFLTKDTLTTSRAIGVATALVSFFLLSR